MLHIVNCFLHYCLAGESYNTDFSIKICAQLVVETHLKGEKRHDNGHPADCHGDVSSPLLGDDVNGAEEEHRPDDVVEDNKAQEGHQDPQWDTHHLQPTQTHTGIIKEDEVKNNIITNSGLQFSYTKECMLEE